MEELEVEQLNTKYVYLGDRGGNFPRKAGIDLSIYPRLIPHENDFKHIYIYIYIYIYEFYTHGIFNLATDIEE